jgi:hypothetical protein
MKVDCGETVASALMLNYPRMLLETTLDKAGTVKFMVVGRRYTAEIPEPE